MTQHFILIVSLQYRLLALIVVSQLTVSHPGVDMAPRKQAVAPAASKLCARLHTTPALSLQCEDPPSTMLNQPQVAHALVAMQNLRVLVTCQMVCACQTCTHFNIAQCRALGIRHVCRGDM